MRAGLIVPLLTGSVVAVFAAGAFSSLAPHQAPSSRMEPLRAEASHDKTSGGGRDFLSPAEVDTAHRAGLLPHEVKSLLATHETLHHGDYRWNDSDVPGGKLKIWVDLRSQMISVFRGGHEIGTAVIVYGATEQESPQGRFSVLFKRRDYHSRTYDAPMPYSMFITNTGVALHGSPMSSRTATHGCIGMPIAFAQRLFDIVKPGDEVEIIQSSADAAEHMASIHYP